MSVGTKERSIFISYQYHWGSVLLYDVVDAFLLASGVCTNQSLARQKRARADGEKLITTAQTLTYDVRYTMYLCAHRSCIIQVSPCVI